MAISPQPAPLATHTQYNISRILGVAIYIYGHSGHPLPHVALFPSQFISDVNNCYQTLYNSISNNEIHQYLLIWSL